MSRAGEAHRVPDVLLERYRLGELDVPEREELQRRLAEDEGLRRRLEELERADAEIRRRYPPEWLAARVRDRLRQAAGPGARRPARSWARGWPVPAAVTAAAIVLLVLAPRIAGPPAAVPGAGPSVGTADRIKGSQPALALYRRTAEGSEPLADGDLVRRGDLLRVGYQAAGRSYGVILSIDGRGAVTRHLPVQGPAAAPLDRGGLMLLDAAYELDDAPRWEAFYFVTSDEPFDVEPVLTAAREAVSRGLGASPPTIELRPDLDQTIFALRKEDTP